MKLSMRAIFMGGLRCADDRRDIGRLTRLMKAASLSATRGVRGREEAMSMRAVFGFVLGFLALAVAAGPAAAQGADKKLKIGVIYDYSGPFAGGGSELHALGAKIIIDHFIKKGGVEGYQIEAVYADAQSKPDVAINEAVRLVEQEKVDMLLGFYSSAECVPAAARVEQLKKFMWITTCISSAVLENRNLKYVFRPQPNGKQFGLLSTDFIANYAKDKLGKEPKGLKVAIIHEDGAYGIDVSKGNEEGAKKAGFDTVLKEGYAATAPDLSSLVTKLKRARPDVLFHTGYNPDITLFLRQAKEQGLRFSALVGHGAGYGIPDKLKESLGADVNHIFNVDPISIWLVNEKALKPGLAEMVKLVGDEYEKARPGIAVKSAHVGMSASNTYVFMTEVLPRAIKQYGGIDAEAMRKAALDVDIPEGGTMLGFGVRFEREGTPTPGQNERANPVVVQYIDDKVQVVWPKALQMRDPVLPLPASSPYAPR
jgi:ABC-type branched-subunit amino acid transport system substrate-binding protein